MREKITADIDLKWTKPKIFIATKKINYKLLPCIEDGFDWHVYYYYKNPYTKILEKFTETLAVNTIKDVDQRKSYIKKLQKAVEYNLLFGFNPYEKYVEPKLIKDLFSKPTVFIPSKKAKGKLLIDTKSDWYIYYKFFNTDSKEFELLKEGENKINTLNLNERIIALKKQCIKLEKKLLDGFNPLKNSKTFSISISDYRLLLKAKKEAENKFLYPHIFVSLKTVEIFHKILKTQNAIDNNNKIKKGFKSVSYNTFHIPDSLHKEFFSTTVLKDFAEFLNEKYDAKIKNKSKFGNQKNDLINKISNIIKNELNNK